MIIFIFDFDIIEIFVWFHPHLVVQPILSGTTIKCTIFFNVHSVLVQRRSTNALQFASCKGWLEDIDASSDPLAPPRQLWYDLIDEKNHIRFFSSSFMIAFILSSNWPRYLVPATNAARSSESLFYRTIRVKLFFELSKARPSTIAVLPTPVHRLIWVISFYGGLEFAILFRSLLHVPHWIQCAHFS
jgi:hypothetical protein